MIQSKAKELVVGTHGRSLYKTNIAHLQKMTNTVLNKKTHIFPIKSIRKSSNWGRSWSMWRDAYEPKTNIPLYLNSKRKIIVDIYKDKTKINSIKVDASKGFNNAEFDLSFSEKGKKSFEKAYPKMKLRKAQNGKYYLSKGKYTVNIDGEKKVLEIK